MSDKGQKYRNENWLREKYWEKKLTTKEIGELAGVSDDTILRWMKKHEIPRRPTGGQVGPSREEFINAIQEVADRIEKSPTISEYKQFSHNDEPSVGAYKRLFGTWDDAKEEAGLTSCSPGIDGPSESECIRSLKKVSNRLGKSPSRREYNEEVSDDVVSAANIAHKFGSWNDAKSAAGLEVTEKHGWSQSEIVDSLTRISEQYTGRLSKRAYRTKRQSTDPSVDTVMRIFGSWNDALEAADLLVQPDEYTEEDCIEALQRVADELGRSPKLREYRSYRRSTDPSPWVMKNSFESWNDMKELAGLYVYQDGSHVGYPYGPNWSAISARIRERDNERCRACGLTSKEHVDIYDRNLEVHHFYKIESFYQNIPDDIKESIQSDGEPDKLVRKSVEEITEKANHPTNLVTVCKKCHSELERLPVKDQIELVDAPRPEVQPSD